jgi:hypothetical protein
MPIMSAKTSGRTASRSPCPRRFKGQCKGKLTSPQRKPLRDRVVWGRKDPFTQVREWKAREDGLGVEREKSLERQNPGEQRIMRGVTAADI